MADETQTTPTEDVKTPDPKDDIVADLFGDEKKEKETETPVEKTEEKTPEKKDEQQLSADIQKREQEALARVERVAKEAEDRLLSRTRSIERRQELNEFFATPDGQLFSKYKSYIEKAASDPAYARLSIAQLPAAILKPTAYSQLLQEARSAADIKAKDTQSGGSTPDVTHRVINREDDPYSTANMEPDAFKKLVEQNQRKMRNA